MGANGGAINAIVAAISHDLGQRNRDGLPDPSFAPAPEPPVDRIPVTVFRRNIAPWRAAAKPPEYTVDNRSVLFGATAPTSFCRFNRQQVLQNTPFRFTQIASPQTCLQMAALNQTANCASTNLSTPPRKERIINEPTVIVKIGLFVLAKELQQVFLGQWSVHRFFGS